MNKEYDYIQLPPIRKDTDSRVVRALWEYTVLPEYARKPVLDQFTILDKNSVGKGEKLKSVIKHVSEEEIAPFNECIRETIRELAQEAAYLAYYVLQEAIIDERPIEQLIEENPLAADMIYAMYILLMRDNKMTDQTGTRGNTCGDILH